LPEAPSSADRTEDRKEPHESVQPDLKPPGRRPRALFLGLLVFGVIAALSIAAPIVAPHDPNHESIEGLASDGGPLDPNAKFLLGTDGKGRDVLSRLIYGGRVTFFASTVSVGVATGIGLLIGLAGAAASARVGGALMRATDIGIAIPGLLLAAAITAVLGQGIASLTIGLSAIFWAPMARVTYGQALIIKERQFVEAARALGAGTRRIMFREVFPHVVPVVAAYAALSVGWAALFESALGFLGVGVQEPTASLGAMLGSGLGDYRAHPGLVAFPALYLGVLVTATTLIGEGLRQPRASERPLRRARSSKEVAIEYHRVAG